MTVQVQEPINKYTGNGSVTAFTYTFLVTDSSDLKVYVAGVQQVSGFTVSGIGSDTGGTVTFSVAPTAGSLVLLQRLVELNRVTDYQEGASLPTDTLDRDFDRIVLMVQDTRAASITLTGGGVLDAKNQRVINVADPVAAQDAATKVWTETAMSSQLALATAQAALAITKASEATVSASNAGTSATNAAASAAAAAISEANAAASAATATTKAAEANTSASAASASATTATTKAGDAGTSAASASTSAATATTKAGEASASATNASTSAGNAAVSATSAATDAAIAAAAAGALTGVVSGKILGRTTAGTGAVEQISIGANLTLASGTLSANPGVPTGAVFAFPATAAPTGYLIANGSLISRTTYAALWAYAQSSGNLAASDGAWAAGKFSPGDGSTTFRIPDMRGEFIRGFDGGRGVDSGRAIGSAQASDNLAHGHGVSDPTHAHGVSDPTHAHGYSGTMLLYGATPNVSGVLVQSGSSVTSPASTGISIAAAGTGISIQSSGGTEARPRNVALLYCIKH